MVYSVVMYGCESWTVKKAEHWRIDAFELWCWRRLLRVPWTARRSNQSIPKEISPGCSLEGLMLKLKLQYFGYLMWRVDSLEKTLGGWGQEKKGTAEDKMSIWHHWFNGHEFEWTLRVGEGQGGLACSNSWSRKESDTTEWLNWTELRIQRTQKSLPFLQLLTVYCPLYMGGPLKDVWFCVVYSQTTFFLNIPLQVSITYIYLKFRYLNI